MTGAPSLSSFTRIITEFGRAIAAKSGFFASRIEYTKLAGERTIACQHAGSDIAIRTIYHPNVWPLRVTAFDGSGATNLSEAVPSSEWVETDVSGPCCTGADIIAHQRMLPPLSPGDWLIIHDVGAYYLASFSRYNCRQAPPMIGYTKRSAGASDDTQVYTFTVLQKQETVDDTLDFFAAS